MSAVQTLKKNNPQQFIKNKYIEQVLQESSRNIMLSQDSIADRSIDNVPETLQARSYTVNNGTLEMRHLVQQRFFDMKPKDGLPQIPIHNKVIWSEYNIIAGIAHQYNITING